MGVRRTGRRLHATRAAWRTCAKEILQTAQPSSIVLVTGPSGAGKSSVLREILHLRRASTIDDARDALMRSGEERTILDHLAGTLDERLELLGRVGLGDATLLARTFDELSEGQRHRFMLAWMLERARSDRTEIVLADEFTSTLDRVTAMAIARSLRRWCNRVRPRAVLVVATAHADVERWLRPDVTVHIRLDGTWRVIRAHGHGA
jgi:ABC-type ATPase with predicted acetyltransferase domain